MNPIRFGIIGLGNMGRSYARSLQAGKVPGLDLVAASDTNPACAEFVRGAAFYSSPEKLFHSGRVEAVVIATPHFSHTTLGIAALQAGLHVIVEKPISVHKADAERLLAAHTNPQQIFAVMFNQRTDPYYRTIRDLVCDGSLGEVRRVSWTITNWFRPEVYYASSDWRATWPGEGGGVLLNQSPHNLDLFSWIFGQPQRVRAFCQFGRYHDIEVEDDVTAYFEYASGTTATFITSTGEVPGTNRLEVCAENGRLVLEDDRLSFKQNAVPMTEFSRTTTEPFSAPPTTERVFEIDGHGEQHLGILRNFVEAVREGASLIAPAAEGLHSVELANAMLLSTWQDRAVSLPLDGAEYADALGRKIAGSRKAKR